MSRSGGTERERGFRSIRGRGLLSFGPGAGELKYRVKIHSSIFLFHCGLIRIAIATDAYRRDSYWSRSKIRKIDFVG